MKLDSIKEVNNEGRPHYRLGDAILRPIHNNSAAEDALDPKYKDTIAQDYLLTRIKGTGSKIDILKAIIEDHIKRKEYPVPDPGELVIHFRIGDFKRVDKISIIYWLLRMVKKSKAKKVTIVTAMHAVASHANDPASYGLLPSFIDELDKNRISYSIKSGEIDEDFCYMVKAKKFIATNGNFSRLAYLCCDGKKLASRKHARIS